MRSSQFGDSMYARRGFIRRAEAAGAPPRETTAVTVADRRRPARIGPLRERTARVRGHQQACAAPDQESGRLSDTRRAGLRWPSWADDCGLTRVPMPAMRPLTG